MSNLKLNSLVEKYKENPSEDLFVTIYNESMTKYRRTAKESAKYYGVDELDLLAAYDDVFMKCLENVTGDFRNLLSSSIRRKKVDLYRSRVTKEKYETYIVDGDGESDAATLDYLLMKQDRVESGDYSEEYVRTNDLPSIIKSITEKIKDPTTTAIVNEVLADETLGKFRPTAIAKKLNVHHSVVTRKLAQLKKYYDSTVFGDYRDYLCG